MSNNFSKSDLARAVAPKLGISNADAAVAVEKILEAIKFAAAEGKKVSLPGFGRFEMKQRAARQGRNPSTGQPVDIPARTSLVFKASKTA